MSLREYSGNAKRTTLTGDITAASTAITVADATGFPTGASAPFIITLEVGQAAEEKVLIQSRSGNNLTVAVSGRGYDGTTASAHTVPATVDHTHSALDAREANAHINDTTLDQHTQYGLRSQGLFANRPAAGRAGRRYYATNTDQEFLDDGTAWHEILTTTTGLTPAAASAAYIAKTDLQSSTVFNNETTTSTAYVALTTAQSVTVTVGANGRLVVEIAVDTYVSTVGALAYTSFALSGANTLAAADGNAVTMGNGATNTQVTGFSKIVLTGLTPGSTTVALRARVSAGTGNFLNRRLIATAL